MSDYEHPNVSTDAVVIYYRKTRRIVIENCRRYCLKGFIRGTKPYANKWCLPERILNIYELGFTYAVWDRYICECVCDDPNTKEIIDRIGGAATN